MDIAILGCYRDNRHQSQFSKKLIYIIENNCKYLQPIITSDDKKQALGKKSVV